MPSSQEVLEEPGEVLSRCDRCGNLHPHRDMVSLGMTGPNGSRSVELCPRCAHAVFVANRRARL
jgi:ribosomal protein S27AE